MQPERGVTPQAAAAALGDVADILRHPLVRQKPRAAMLWAALYVQFVRIGRPFRADVRDMAAMLGVTTRSLQASNSCPGAVEHLVDGGAIELRGGYVSVARAADVGGIRRARPPDRRSRPLSGIPDDLDDEPPAPPVGAPQVLRIDRGEVRSGEMRSGESGATFPTQNCVGERGNSPTAEAVGELPPSSPARETGKCAPISPPENASPEDVWLWVIQRGVDAQAANGWDDAETLRRINIALQRKQLDELLAVPRRPQPRPTQIDQTINQFAAGEYARIRWSS